MIHLLQRRTMIHIFVHGKIRLHAHGYAAEDSDGERINHQYTSKQQTQD